MAPATATWNDLQKWSYSVGGPISIVSCILLILIFNKYKHMRKPPGNMLLATIICEMFGYL